MFFDRKALMTALVVLVSVTKSQLALAGGPHHHGGGFGGLQNHMPNQNQMSGQNLLKTNFQKPVNFTPNVLKNNNIQNPVLQQVNKVGNNNPLQGKLQNVNLGNLGQNKGINFPQFNKNHDAFKPNVSNLNGLIGQKIHHPDQFKNGNFNGLFGKLNHPDLGKDGAKNPQHPDLGKDGMKNHHHHDFPFGGFLLGLGIGSNFGNGYPYYGGYGYPVPTSYGWPVATTTYVSTTPQVIEVPTPTPWPQLPTNNLPPAPAALTQIDLAITDVRLVDAGSPTTGPMYRVIVTNKGANNMNTTTRLAAVATIGEQSSQEPVVQIETVPMLNAGQSAEVSLRMPVAAKAFPMLLIAAEVPANFQDTNEQNNVAQGVAAQIPALVTAMK